MKEIVTMTGSNMLQMYWTCEHFFMIDRNANDSSKPMSTAGSTDLKYFDGDSVLCENLLFPCLKFFNSFSLPLKIKIKLLHDLTCHYSSSSSTSSPFTLHIPIITNYLQFPIKAYPCEPPCLCTRYFLFVWNILISP